jgi:glycosyltransferase involved in cell wall biosynthesis
VKKSGDRPRIAVYTKQLDQWTSGSGHHLHEILNAALDLNHGRFDFTFLHHQRVDDPIYSRVRELLVPRNPVLAAIALRRERFDVVHYTPLTIYAPIWGVPSRKVATVHGAEQFHVPQFYGKLELLHEHLVVPPYIRRMDRVVTVSETSARFFVTRFGVAPEAVVVCPNAVSPLYRVLPREGLTAAGRWGIRGPYILHVSRLSGRKNPWTLLEAFRRLVKDHGVPHVLACAGGGWNEPAVRDRVKALGIAERFLAPGFVPEKDVAELMNGADAFVFPSLAEGFGMPNVEAMACGCPVITTPGFAMREIVGDAALVVEDPLDASALSDAIHRVISDAELRAGLISRGLVRAARYSWKESAERLLAMYGELTGS